MVAKMVLKLVSEMVWMMVNKWVSWSVDLLAEKKGDTKVF